MSEASSFRLGKYDDFLAPERSRRFFFLFLFLLCGQKEKEKSLLKRRKLQLPKSFFYKLFISKAERKSKPLLLKPNQFFFVIL
ncbi:MAG: hypothetical protein IKW37_02315 [Bacteroidaceae bacterium]|nr:hypothetical protein [Bacteroidaceae bacterium]